MDQLNAIDAVPVSAAATSDHAGPAISSKNSEATQQQHAWTTPSARAFLSLAMCCLVVFGSYYILAIPASVRQHLKDSMASKDFEAKFQLLCTMAYLPNIFLPIIAGSLVDLIGARICLLVLSATCFLGQILTTIGVDQESWSLLLTGRFIFGFGFESLFVSNEAFLSDLFQTGGRGMALGLSGAASYTGYLMAPVLSPIVANTTDVAFSFWVGALIMGVSVLAAVIVCFILAPVPPTNSTCCGKSSNEVSFCLSKRVRILETSSEPKDREEKAVDHTETMSKAERRVRLSGICKFSASYWLLCISCPLAYASVTAFVSSSSGILLESYLLRNPSTACTLKFVDKCPSGYLEPIEGNPTVSVVDGAACVIGDHYAPVPPLSLNMTAYDEKNDRRTIYVFPHLKASEIDCSDNFWSHGCTQQYCDLQEKATQRAGIYVAVPFIITVATSFFFGRYGVDRWCRPAEMIALGPTLLVVAHSLLAFSYQTTPILIPLVLMGFGYSIYISALWPFVPQLVPKNAVGTAYGLMVCFQACGNAFFPLVVVAVYNRADQHFVPDVEIFFVSSTILLVVIGLLIIFLDRKKSRQSRCPSLEDGRELDDSQHEEAPSLRDEIFV